MKGPKEFCKAVSVVFAPQVSSVYAFAALSLASGIETTGFLLLIAVLFVSLIPTATLFAYVRRSKMDSNIEEKGDRPVLFFTATLFYLAGFVSLRYLGAPFIFDALMFAYFVNTILAAFITKYVTKVSIHTWGVTGPSIAILYGCGLASFIVVLAAGSIVAASRVMLGYHTVNQVTLSVLVSIPFTWFVIYILPAMLPTLF
jgi:hypothetical protein